MTAEDDRAAEFRRMMKARTKAKRATERALAGDKAARKALEAKTEALLTRDENGVPRAGIRR